MAEVFVRKEHFAEFVVRMDECFLAVEKRMEQGFARAEKAREQNFVHLNQRIDDFMEGVNQRFDSLEKMLAWQNRSVLGILAVVLAAAVKYLFFPN